MSRFDADPMLRAWADTAPELVERVLDALAAAPRAQLPLEPVASPAEAASALLDLRAGHARAGAVRVVFSDESQIAALFRGACGGATRAETRDVAVA